jgi:diaminopimelate decarboxylase
MSTLDRMSGILPDTATVNGKGHLAIGACDTVDLASQYGTPLYIFDEDTVRRNCARFVAEFGRRYQETSVIYAAKAYISPALAHILQDEGLGLDVVSGGELSIARSADFPMERVYFHGNNKQQDEIDLAIACGVGRIVVDNIHELGMLDRAAKKAGASKEIMLRLTPGIDAHTHQHIATGILDTKFGFPIASGQAEEAVVAATKASNLKLIGLHAHIGSLIYSAEPYEAAIDVVLRFAASMKKHGLSLKEFSPGGGFAVQYTLDKPAPDISYYAEAIANAVRSKCSEFGLEPPLLIVEPGRAIVARAGVSLCGVGSIKEIPGVRKYVAVDGGMADNIRPALYGSRYEALLANKTSGKPAERTTIAGKFCESGDILARDASLPRVEPGDLVAIPVTGAYCLPMASNYNASLKPAVVMVREGRSRLIRRRERYEDLLQYDGE